MQRVAALGRRLCDAGIRGGRTGGWRRLHDPYLFFSLPRTGTTVTTVGRTASGETVLGGDVSFLGFLTIFWDC